MKNLAVIRFLCDFGNAVGRYLAFATALCLLACGAAGPGEDEEVLTEQEPLTAVYQINIGGGAVSPFTADQFASGGNAWTDNVTVSTAGVTNAAPADVYKSERYGNFSYSFGSLTAGASYTVRLHFAENHWASAGARVFNVVINGSQVLSNFDIFANAGANKALVREFTTTASASGQIAIQYVTVTDNAKASAIEILSNAGGGNAPPTVATAASANPNPTNGTTAALSVLGADDGGEANLIYTWATTGTPPAGVSFSANGTNAAKSATATFTKAGAYTLAATIRDASGATVTSNVNVNVNQKLTSIAITPSSASVATNGSQAFVASAKDQFATAMSPQPAITWAVSGGGSINASGVFSAGSTSGGPFTVTATSGAVSGTAAVTVTSGSITPVYRINVGGGALSPFAADQFASGGSTWTNNATVSTAGVTNAAPAGVYQSERYGNFSYTFGSLTAGATYTVRLHFAESHWNSSGARVFNVVINGSQVLSNFDIFANAGANKALVREFNTTASGSGQVVLQYVTVVDNAKASGIEILTTGGGSGNQAPTVATAASANPNPTIGTTTALSVLGADDAGESNLTYTWATTGTPPAAVSFSANGTNAAKNATATFTKAGAYTLAATIRDGAGATVTSNVNVSVNQKLTSIGVTPASASVAVNGSQQFLATAKDQFAAAMSPQPSISWAVSGGGSINSIGLFSAGSASGGPFTVSATSGAVSGTSSVTVTSGAVSYVTDFNLTESPISEGGAWRQLGVDWTRVITGNGFAYGTQSGNNGFNDSYAYLAAAFPANQSASAVIHLESGITAQFAEVEILLRWTDSAHNSIGYECNLAFNGQYAEIIKWPGPLGTSTSQFTWLSSGNPVAGGVHDGDVFQADVIGNVVTSRLNGNVLATGTDNSITSGSPGIGFYWQGGPASQKFSFTRFSATGL